MKCVVNEIPLTIQQMTTILNWRQLKCLYNIQNCNVS